MKKVIDLLVVFSFLMHNVNGQNESGQSVYKRDIIITPYIGFPNVLTTVLKNANELANPKKEQVSISAFGPIGINAFYLLTDKLAIGGEMSYSSTEIQWKESGFLEVNDSAGILYTYRFLIQAPRIRILGKLNYHFATGKHHDWYLGFGLGYNYTRIKLLTNAHGNDYKIPALCFLPFSARTNLGFNYYFTKNVAVNAELGIGGPLTLVGITCKF